MELGRNPLWEYSTSMHIPMKDFCHSWTFLIEYNRAHWKCFSRQGAAKFVIFVCVSVAVNLCKHYLFVAVVISHIRHYLAHFVRCVYNIFRINAKSQSRFYVTSAIMFTIPQRGKTIPFHDSKLLWVMCARTRRMHWNNILAEIDRKCTQLWMEMLC